MSYVEAEGGCERRVKGLEDGEEVSYFVEEVPARFGVVLVEGVWVKESIIGVGHVLKEKSSL